MDSIGIDNRKNKIGTRKSKDKQLLNDEHKKILRNENSNISFESTLPWYKCNPQQTSCLTIIIQVTVLVTAIIAIGLLLLPLGYQSNVSKHDLMDQRKLWRLMKEGKSEEGVEWAKAINEKVNSSASLYNLAVCLEYNGELEKAAEILQDMFGKIERKKDNSQIDMTEWKITKAVEIDMQILQEIFKSKKGEQLVHLKKKPDEEMVRQFLLRLYLRLGKNETFLSIVKQTASVHQILKTLNFAGGLNYDFRVYGHDNIFLQLTMPTYSMKNIIMHDFILDVSLLPRSLQKLTLENTEVFVNGETELPNLKYLYLKGMSSSCLSYFQSAPELNILSISDSSLDVSLLPPSLLKLNLEKTDVFMSRHINLPNLTDLDLSGMNSPMSYFHSVPLHTITTAGSTLDVSFLPPSLQELFLYKTEVFVSGGIDLPNLKYLELCIMNSSSLSHFRLVPLTHIDFWYVDEVNVDVLPQSAKEIKIRNDDYRHIPTKVIGGVRKLDKLILQSFSLDQADKLLSHLKPKQLVIGKKYPGFEPTELISLMDRQIIKIAIGIVGCEAEAFNSCILSKHVDRQSDFYLLEGGRGKAVEKDEFDELNELL